MGDFSDVILASRWWKSLRNVPLSPRRTRLSCLWKTTVVLHSKSWQPPCSSRCLAMPSSNNSLRRETIGQFQALKSLGGQGIQASPQSLEGTNRLLLPQDLGPSQPKPAKSRGAEISHPAETQTPLLVFKESFGLGSYAGSDDVIETL